MRRPWSATLLRERNFARYLAAVSVSTLGSGISNVALAFAILEFGSATDLGVVFVAREVPMIILLLLGGVYADRLSRRTILATCDALKGVAQLGTALLILGGNASLLSIVLLQVGFGAAQAFSRPARIGLVRETVPSSLLQDANALLGLAQSVSSIGGPALGALIAATIGAAEAIAIDGATFFISAALTASMTLTPGVRTVAASVMGDLREGWRELVSRPWAVAVILSFGLFQLTFFPAMLVLGPVVAEDKLGGAGAWGVILVAQSVGAVAGGLVALRIRVQRPLVATELFVLPAGILLATLVVPAPLGVIAAVGFASGLGFAAGETLWVTVLQHHVPEHAVSRVSSFDWLGSVALNPLGYALIGPISAVLGTPETLAICAALNVSVCLVVAAMPFVRTIGMDPTDAGQPLTEPTT